MARMMPPYCPSDASPGEKDLFRLLAQHDETDDWIVLHSLAIASHTRQVEGEADFVVIVPNRGILVIEVKAHLSIKCTPDGMWKLGSQAPTPRSPFKQAAEAMHSIRAYLLKQGVSLRSVPILNVVWFTHLRARAQIPSSPEWHPWQLLDSEDMRRGVPAAVLRAFSHGTMHLNSKVPFFAESSRPDAGTALRIANVLRPRFETAVVAGDVRRARQAQLVAFIDEQYDALDNMQHNSKVLFTGPAGSGKTWLAMEAARREVAEGRTGRLLCYNRLLGQHLSAQLGEYPGLRVSTFHQELLRLTGAALPSGANDRFWDHDLPCRATDVLLDGLNSEEGEFLIIDEAQDLARPEFLDILELLVQGGFAEGRVRVFGDFERQAIYGSGGGPDIFRARIPGLASYQLTVNCRNLPRIGAAVERLSHLVPGYRRFRRPDDGADPEFIPVLLGVDQSMALSQVVQQLQDEGYQLDEIVILSPLRNESAAERVTDPRLRQILRPAAEATPLPGKLRYTTISAFKGLESPAVILTDLDARGSSSFEAILYVGLTRATDRLFALIDPETFRKLNGGSRERS
ncbi:NERD domain-containing protein [Micromonosporaceae bacterium DT194]|uniref:nuclease-related domain-containing DEAD/DEAH box helicase n=1 Tax=Melissospora conviva TaxID=3388432 RepID=UPI003C1F96A6